MEKLFSGHLIMQQWPYLAWLPKAEQQQFSEFRSILTGYSPIRGKAGNQFNDVLKTLRSFVNRCDGFEWRRSLVCGIGWIQEYIVINQQRLKQLIGREKSFISGRLAELGYVVLSTHKVKELGIHLKQYFHSCVSDGELRAWSFRQDRQDKFFNTRPHLQVQATTFHTMQALNPVALQSITRSMPVISLQNVMDAENEQRHLDGNGDDDNDVYDDDPWISFDSSTGIEDFNDLEWFSGINLL
jgi:hypothetical protein